MTSHSCIALTEKRKTTKDTKEYRDLKSFARLCVLGGLRPFYAAIRIGHSDILAAFLRKACETSHLERKTMSQEPAQQKSPSRLVIRNIGLLLSGDLEKPILDADTVLAVDGKIAAVGKEKDIDSAGSTTFIDAKETTLAPGLIDSHVHPVAGDWTPRQNQLG
jgi:hypothetical protein